MAPKLRELLFTNTSEKHAALRNGFWRFASSGVGKLIRLAVILFVARVLGAEQFGVYAYALSVASLCFMFADWGMNTIIIREVSRTETVQEVQSALFVKGVTSGISALVGLCAFVLVSGGAYVSVGLPLVAVLFFSNINESLVSVFIGRQRGEFEFVGVISEILVLVGSIFWFVRGGHLTVHTFTYAVAIAAAVATVVNMLMIVRLRVLSWRLPSLQSLRYFFIQGMPMAWFGLIGYAFFSSDQLFLKHYFDFATVGQYALATRVVYATLILPGIITSVALPVFTRALGDVPRMRRVFWRGLVAMLGCSLVVIIPVTFFGRFLVSFLSQDYAATLPVLIQLSFFAIPLFVLIWLDNILVMLGLQWKNLAVTTGAVIVNIGLNFWLVPVWGVQGALLATGISQGLNMLVTFGLIQAHMSRTTV